MKEVEDGWRRRSRWMYRWMRRKKEWKIDEREEKMRGKEQEVRR